MRYEIKADDIYSTRDIERHAKGYFFSQGAMKFFSSRLSQDVFKGPGGVYFVTSEQGPDGVRAYSVREFKLATGQVETKGEFQAYETLAKAKAAAKQHAKG